MSTQPRGCISKSCHSIIPGQYPGFHCGSQGNTTHPGWLDRFVSCSKDYTSCFNECAANSLCTSFAYNKANNFCRLFTKTINEKGFLPSNSTDIYHWNLDGCFEVPSCARPTTVSSTTTTTSPTSTPIPTNLFTNPSLETSFRSYSERGPPNTFFISDWYTSDSWYPLPVTINASAAHDGRNYALLNFDNFPIPDDVRTYVYDLDTSGATTYDLSFWLRVINAGDPNDPCALTISVNSAESPGIPIVPPLNVWRKVTRKNLVVGDGSNTGQVEPVVAITVNTCQPGLGSAVLGIDTLSIVPSLPRST